MGKPEIQGHLLLGITFIALNSFIERARLFR